MSDLRAALLLDAMAVLSAVLLLARVPGVRLSHPGVIYVAIHIYVVSFRGWAIERGAPTFLLVESNAVATAVMTADLFLVTAVSGWVFTKARPGPAEPRYALVTRPVVVAVALVTVPIGVITLLAVGYVPGVGEGGLVVTSSYQTVAVLWPALACLSYIYVRGFKLWPLVFLLGYLAVLGVQGHSRFRVVIPLIMLVLIWLDSRGKRWPSKKLIASGLLLFAVFIPLKDIGTAVRSGQADLSTVTAVLSQSTEEAARGTNTEQALLDQMAITLLLVDARGSAFHGRPYLALVTLPVPRTWWPEKPGLADHAIEFSTPRYPLAEVGGVTGLTGDLYLNFGLLGVGLGALLFSILTARYFNWTYSAPFGTARRYAYILVAACYVQVARDGVAAIVIFTLVNSTPWLVVAVLSWWRGRTAAGSTTVVKKEVVGGT